MSKKSVKGATRRLAGGLAVVPDSDPRADQEARLREAAAKAASDERRRLAVVMDDARRILGLYAGERPKNDALAKPAAMVLRHLNEALSDRNAQAALPVPQDWWETRMRLESSLKVCVELIREHLSRGAPGVPGARVREVLEAADLAIGESDRLCRRRGPQLGADEDDL